MLLGVLGALAIFAIIVLLGMLYRGAFPSIPRSAVALSVVLAASASAIWLLASSLVPGVWGSALNPPTAALAALAAYLWGVPWLGWSAVARIVVTIGATVVVFVPVALLVLFPTAMGSPVTSAPLDMGGALPVHVSAGAAALGVLVIDRRAPKGTLVAHPPAGFIAGIALGVWATWLFALVAMELAIDEATKTIVFNAVAAPCAAIVGWLMVQRMLARSTTVRGAVTGLVCGLVAVTPGSSYLSPLWAIVTGVIAGIVCAIFGIVRVRASGRPFWILVAMHLIAAAIGLVLLGLFGAGYGFIFTGQPESVLTQLTSTLLVVAWSAAVAIALRIILRRIAVSRPVP